MPVQKSVDGMLNTPRRKPQPRLIAKPSFISLQDRRPIDGILPRPVRNHPRSVAATTAKPPIRPAVFAKPIETVRNTDVVMRVGKGRRLTARLFTVVQYFGLAGIALVAAYSTGIGQWFVLAYALVVLVTRRSSQLTFGVALFLLVSVPLFQILGQTGVADNMAVYVYELLVVGTIQAIIELKWPAKSTA